MPESLFVPCKIERGGFSSERVFEIKVSHEGDSLTGTANLRYLLDEHRRPLSPDSPAPGTTIDGFVQCLLIEQSVDGTVTIEVPSTDMLNVSEDELVKIE